MIGNSTKNYLLRINREEDVHGWFIMYTQQEQDA